jgi:hypothetical protein
LHFTLLVTERKVAERFSKKSEQKVQAWNQTPGIKPQWKDLKENFKGSSVNQSANSAVLINLKGFI